MHPFKASFSCLRRYSTEPHPLLTRHQLALFAPHRTSSTPPDGLSDLEWQTRTGRAIDILEQTLPDFFHLGLVSSIDPTPPTPSEARTIDSIYSPTIRLTYMPPLALPPPFPRTLALEGLPLYMTSSVFIRHTMKTLYSDLHISMRRVAVHATPSRPRDKSLFVGLTVHGTTRVSGGQGEWQVDSTYGFSPVSGLINVHTIDSIQPAPHQAAYDALRASLSGVFGIGDMRPGQAR